jgi:DNA-binding response OmpR family regulator
MTEAQTNPANPNPITPPSPPSQAADGQKKLKILIVEDDDQLQKSYEKLFSAEGFQVIQAFTATQGIELAHSEVPNLILLDIMLPGGSNGFDVLEQIKRDRDLFNIPVIMLTNLDSERQSALSIGAADYLIKANTSIEDLLKKAKDCLDEAQTALSSISSLPNHFPGKKTEPPNSDVF